MLFRYICFVEDTMYGFSFPMQVVAEDRLSALEKVQIHTDSVNNKKGYKRYKVTREIREAPL